MGTPFGKRPFHLPAEPHAPYAKTLCGRQAKNVRTLFSWPLSFGTPGYTQDCPKCARKMRQIQKEA